MSSSRNLKTMRRTVLPDLVLMLLLLLFMLPERSSAQTPAERPWTLGIAVGHGERSNPFVASDDMDINAVLDLAWYGEHFFFDNGDVGYTFTTTSRLSASALLTFNNERNYFSYLSNGGSGLDVFALRRLAESAGLAGSSLVGTTGERPIPLEELSAQELEDLIGENIDTDLPDRDFAGNAGLELLYISPWGDLQAQLLTDATSTHNGESAHLSWTYPWLFRNGEFSLTLGAEWKSTKLVDYYYGVARDEVLPGRDYFEGGSGTNRLIRFRASRDLSRHWKLVSVLEREYLSSAIRRSPVIKDDQVDTFFIGLYYQF